MNEKTIVYSILIGLFVIMCSGCGSTKDNPSDISDPIPLLGDPLPGDFPMADPGIAATLMSDASAPAC